MTTPLRCTNIVAFRLVAYLTHYRRANHGNGRRLLFQGLPFAVGLLLVPTRLAGA